MIQPFEPLMRNAEEIKPDKDSFFRKQFLLGDREIESLEHWPNRKIGDHILYTHPGLEVTFRESARAGIALVGYMCDYRHPHRHNQDIVNAMEIDCSIESMLAQLTHMSGIYLVIWKTENGIFLIPDLGVAREVYVYRNEGRVVAASTPNILGLTCSLQKVDNGFYTSAAFKRRFVWVADKTCYDHIVRLKPNHYFAVRKAEMIRFFPDEKLAPVSLADAVKTVSDILPRILQAYACREEKLMMGLTAGWDSRLLLAASRAIKDKLIYYVNIYAHSPMSDHRIPIRLAQKLDLTFIAVRIAAKEKQETSDILRYVPRTGGRDFAWLHGFQSLFEGYRSLNGSVGEVTRNEYASMKKLTGSKLAQLAQFPGDAFCATCYDEWLGGNKDRFIKFGYSVPDMFYWEESMATGLGKMTTDLHARNGAMFPPLNCRILITTLLGVERRYRQKQHNILYREIIRSLWKEALDEPVNPNVKKQVIRMMQWCRVYGLYRSIFVMGIVPLVRRVFPLKLIL